MKKFTRAEVKEAMERFAKRRNRRELKALFKACGAESIEDLSDREFNKIMKLLEE
jgi:UDP:flavonoid glycosyltransferase YjiC (YdhE family)